MSQQPRLQQPLVADGIMVGSRYEPDPPASHPTPPPGGRHSIRERACGSVFAGTVIKSLTSTNGVAMQPEDPNDNQVAAFNAYTRSIIDVCRSDVSRWDKPNLTFSAQDDEWEGAWYGRTGIPSDIPLGYFKDRYYQLVNVPYTADSIKKLNLVPHPSNTGETTVQPGPTECVYLVRSKHLRKTMTRAMIDGDVRMMAQLLLQTCPGDWNRGWSPGLSTMLKDAVKHGIEPEKRRACRYIDITEFIKYRWELAEMADYFVQEHKLRKPDDEICILWNDFEWSVPACQTIPGYSDRFGMAYSHLVYKGFHPEPVRSQGPYFNRFIRYMAAAVALRNLSREKNDLVLESLVSSMDKYEEFYKKICTEDKGVLQKQREWHEAIGR